MNNQIINEIADWKLIRKAVEQGVRIDIDLWKAYRDLRLKVMLRSFAWAGQFDSSVYQWDENKINWQYPSQGTRLVHGQGMLEIALFDTSYGANRWFRWKNKEDIYQHIVYTNSIPVLWSSGNYAVGTIKFCEGSLWKVTAANGTNECPVSVIKTEPNVQYEFSDQWALFYAGPPNCYYNNTTQRYETKIRADIWQKSRSYEKDDCVSWNADTRNGQTANPVCWRAKRDILFPAIAPHNWYGDTWQAIAWPKDKLVLSTDGIRVYQAKNKIQNIAIPPENNPAEWLEREDLACEWELIKGYRTNNDKWQLVPDWGNYECDWNVNFPGLAIFNDIVREDEDEIRDYRQCHPSLYFPRQVDPGAIHEEIIYAYKEPEHINASLQRGKRYKKGSSFKVPLDHTYLTKPENLGPIFSIRARMGYWQKETFPYQIFVERRDALGILNGFLDGFNKYKSFDGNQYINYGNLIERNSPASVGNWSANDKVDGSLQSNVEIIMNDNALKLPANGTYTQNWMRLYFSDPPAEPSVGSIYYVNGSLQRKTETGWEGVSVHELSSWPEYPNVNDECWGTAESGLRTYLVHKYKKYDWAYNMDTATRYYPFNIIHSLYTQCIDPYDPNNPPSESALMEQWNLHHDGDYFETFKFGCGRVRPFMRAQERGLPTHYKDSWNPSFAPYGYPIIAGNIVYDSSKWFAPRTNDRPRLDEFDDKFVAIVPFEEGLPWLEDMPYKKWTVRIDAGKSYFAKTDIAGSVVSPGNDSTNWQRCKIYAFAINGENRFNNADDSQNIKVGWILHLFNMNGGSYPQIVSNDPDAMKCVHVLDIRYDSENNRTIVTVSDTINIGTQENFYFTRAGWSKEICERHDASAADYTMSENGELSFTLRYEVKLEALLDLYDLLEFAIYHQAWPNLQIINGDFHKPTSRQEGTLNMGGVISEQISLLKAAMSKNPLEWPSGGYANPSVGGTDTQAEDTTPEFELKEVWSNRSGLATAMRCLAWNPPLNGLPSSINVKLGIEDVLDEYDMLTSQTAGGLSTRFVKKPEDVKWRYTYINLGVGNESFYKLIPTVFNYKKVISWAEFRSNGWYIDWFGGANLGTLLFDVSDVWVTMDYDIVPVKFFDPTFYYTVGPRLLQIDNKPPRPDPPVHRYNPFAKLKYILPYYLLTPRQREEIEAWHYDSEVGGNEYQAGDKVFQWMNGKHQLFTAKNYIAESIIPPMNDPDNWTWEKPWVELHINGESCLCTDYEDSNPVRYRMICNEDGNLSTDYIPQRQQDLLLKEIQLKLREVVLSGTPATILSNINYHIWQQDHEPAYTKGSLVLYDEKLYRVIADPCVTDTHSVPDSAFNPDYVKCKTVIPLATTEWSVGDIIESIGTVALDAVGPIIYIGDIFIEADFGQELQYLTQENSFPLGNRIINRTQTYTVFDWMQEEFVDYNFALQARDSANARQGVPDNQTKLSRFIKVEPPTDYMQFYDETEDG